MFDFLDRDPVVLVINVLFLIFIYFDYKKYKQTRQRLYLFNIILTLGFAIWVLLPLYTKYITWSAPQRAHIENLCRQKASQKFCHCYNDKLFKSYSFDALQKEDRNSSTFSTFDTESKKSCQEEVDQNSSAT